MKLLELLRGRAVVCCVGSGGVGKTTTAAAIGLQAAAEGKRVLVMTIDPARRLANSLGLKELGNLETRIDPKLVPKGELWAMMLDLKRSWDDLVKGQARSVEQAERILKNRIYESLSTAMAGSLEYIAMEKVYEVHASGRYDLVVLDTPPTTNAMDFLHAADRILDVLDNSAFKILFGPMMKAGKFGLKLFAAPSGIVLRTLARFTGAAFLRELSDFLMAFEGLFDGFKERAGKVRALLKSKAVAFVLVTSPNPLTIQEALFFHRALKDDGIATAAVVVNRVQRDPKRQGGPDNVAALREALTLAQIKDQDGLAERLCQTLTEQTTLADVDRREVARLRRELAGVPLFQVPRLRKDVHDLAGLWQIDSFLASATGGE
ncbi:MAG TPA: ArsA-related P-loop ATPase [Myxococcales bacterium]